MEMERMGKKHETNQHVTLTVGDTAIRNISGKTIKSYRFPVVMVCDKEKIPLLMSQHHKLN